MQPSKRNYNTPLTKILLFIYTRFNSNKTKVNRFTSFLSNFSQVLTINHRFGDKRFMAAEFGVTRIFLFESFRFLSCVYKNQRNILAGVNFITWKNSFQGVENHTCLRRETSSKHLNITLFEILILWNLPN